MNTKKLDRTEQINNLVCSFDNSQNYHKFIGMDFDLHEDFYIKDYFGGVLTVKEYVTQLCENWEATGVRFFDSAGNSIFIIDQEILDYNNKMSV